MTYAAARIIVEKTFPMICDTNDMSHPNPPILGHLRDGTAIAEVLLRDERPRFRRRASAIDAE